MTAAHVNNLCPATPDSSLVICAERPATRRAWRMRLARAAATHAVAEVSSASELTTAWRAQSPALVIAHDDVAALAPALADATLRDPHVPVLLIRAGQSPGQPPDWAASGVRHVLAPGAAGRRSWALATRLLTASPPTSAAHHVSQREVQVLMGMSRGMTNSQIAAALFLSEETVKTLAQRLFRKLQVPDRAAAVAWGIRHHVIP